ncbi:heavy metal-binding protein HIP-like [Ruditapes philippinarum]|uniref:heavy metal-binding protein HIP-like n=1 Tax=Ruditapes philippinarum TaxID=129788 RepID=UPI00295AD4A0|nr:heavy metal-binding protein HIP-like [Ruditapes philippinarum]
MKFLLSILVIIDNLNVLLASNDNCRENDLNALMVRLRQLRTDFANLEIQHAEQINATQAEIGVLKEANDNQETELKKLRQEINKTSSEIGVLKEANDTQEKELEKLRQEINKTSSKINTLNRTQETELIELRKEIATIKVPIVGFNAHLSTSGKVNKPGTVVFDVVITNQGADYNSSTGIFAAPYTGLYFFSVQLCNKENTHTYYGIHQKSRILARSYGYNYNSSWECSSVSIIAMLNKAEQVWVNNYDTIYDDYHGKNYFSGSLLNK